LYYVTFKAKANANSQVEQQEQIT